MRLLILFLSFITLTSCDNKKDLLRIAELEKENKELRDSIVPEKLNLLYKTVENNILDSIVFGVTMRDKMTCILFDTYKAINTSSGKFVQLNTKQYQTDNHFVIDRSKDFDSILYTIPAKDKSVLNWRNYYDSLDRMTTSGKNFKYTPKDTGWFYYYCAIQIKNRRTDQVTSYPSLDSFYVYK